MNKQLIKSHIKVRNEWNEVEVSVGLPLGQDDIVAEVVCSHFDGGDWVITRCWTPEVYMDTKILSVLLEEARVVLSKKVGFTTLLVQPRGQQLSVEVERAFFLSNGFKETVWSKRTLQWKQTGMRVGIVKAEAIFSHPTLSLLAEDHLDT